MLPCTRLLRFQWFMIAFLLVTLVGAVIASGPKHGLRSSRPFCETRRRRLDARLATHRRLRRHACFDARQAPLLPAPRHQRDATAHTTHPHAPPSPGIGMFTICALLFMIASEATLSA